MKLKIVILIFFIVGVFSKSTAQSKLKHLSKRAGACDFDVDNFETEMNTLYESFQTKSLNDPDKRSIFYAEFQEELSKTKTNFENKRPCIDELASLEQAKVTGEEALASIEEAKKQYEAELAAFEAEKKKQYEAELATFEEEKKKQYEKEKEKLERQLMLKSKSIEGQHIVIDKYKKWIKEKQIDITNSNKAVFEQAYCDAFKVAPAGKKKNKVRKWPAYEGEACVDVNKLVEKKRVCMDVKIQIEDTNCYRNPCYWRTRKPRKPRIHTGKTKELPEDERFCEARDPAKTDQY